MKTRLSAASVSLGVSAALALGTVLATCAPAAAASTVRSMLEFRHENVVVQQWDNSCGAAALATILTYQLGDPVTEKRIAHDMLAGGYIKTVQQRGGFSLLDMKRYVSTRGFEGIGYGNLSVDDLRRLTPVIVPVRLEGFNHFVVFRGVAAGHALLADPAFGNRKVPVEQFEKMWNGKLAFVVRPPSTRLLVNNIAPRQNDFVAVDDDTVRIAEDNALLPPPLADWQMQDVPWRPMAASLAEALANAAPQSAPVRMIAAEPASNATGTTVAATTTSSATTAVSASAATRGDGSSVRVPPAVPSAGASGGLTTLASSVSGRSSNAATTAPALTSPAVAATTPAASAPTLAAPAAAATSATTAAIVMTSAPEVVAPVAAPVVAAAAPVAAAVPAVTAPITNVVAPVVEAAPAPTRAAVSTTLTTVAQEASSTVAAIATPAATLSTPAPSAPRSDGRAPRRSRWTHRPR